MMGDVPHPTTVVEYWITVCEILVAVLVFAAIIGNVGNIITSMNAERDEFQGKMDGVKRYMILRRVNKDIQRRIIRSVFPASVLQGKLSKSFASRFGFDWTYAFPTLDNLFWEGWGCVAEKVMVKWCGAKLQAYRVYCVLTYCLPLGAFTTK